MIIVIEILVNIMIIIIIIIMILILVIVIASPQSAPGAQGPLHDPSPAPGAPSRPLSYASDYMIFNISIILFICRIP